MNKKHSSFHLGIGTPSIFMIFVILVMCILAVLAYLKANTFYESTLRQVTITSAYYQSEAELFEVYYQLDGEHIDEQLKTFDIEYEKRNHQYLLQNRIDNDFQLQLLIEVKNQKLEIISLKKVSERG